VHGEMMQLTVLHESQSIYKKATPNHMVGNQSFKTVNKNVHFYYLPTKKAKTPDIPTNTKAWQGFYDNNKIASRNNRRTATKKRSRQETRRRTGATRRRTAARGTR
jgi:hypothetical protein